MNITIKNLVVKSLRADLERMGIEINKHRYYSDELADVTIDLTSRTKQEVVRLKELLEASGLRGTKVIVADMGKYLKASEQGAAVTQARTGRQMAWLLEQYVAGLPHHVLFSQDEYGGNSHSGYLVTDVDYQPEVTRSSVRDYRPESVEMTLAYVVNDVRRTTGMSFEQEDFTATTPVAMLRKRGFVPETPDLLAKLERETIRYFDVREKIGMQHLATGIGLADLESEGATRRTSSAYGWRASSRIRLDNFGAECRVVIDVLNEGDSEARRRGSDSSINPYRWHSWNMRFFAPAEDDLARHLAADENTAQRPDVLLPVHPLVPVFDLTRHDRLRVHVNNLAPYEYRKDIATTLVLPERDWRMVNLLVDHSRNYFQDIVGGKGQSMNILSEGPPGTGKTATAEVFAEFKERPLYSVQCSQLGTQPEQVEKNLRVVLDRANRWDAILLLDEADVYIRRRGTDIQQNAIVGTFLRVLEYAKCIMFLTTNLPDDVDDAIASRCIARLRYDAPGPELQARIWRNLATLNGIPLGDADIHAIATKYPDLSGRDVKNLLKLASFVAQAEQQPVTRETIEYVMLFKPTPPTTHAMHA